MLDYLIYDKDSVNKEKDKTPEVRAIVLDKVYKDVRTHLNKSFETN